MKSSKLQLQLNYNYKRQKKSSRQLGTKTNLEPGEIARSRKK